jgi:exo-beta-1,3-glucanase (GH17 family)/cellulose synthase/poly-beta-1,6-N-acetylglucosamine synthase-like glycosyltransferase
MRFRLQIKKRVSSGLAQAPTKRILGGQAPLTTRRSTWSVWLLALLIAWLNHSLWSFLGESYPAPHVQASVHGLTYAPYARRDAPWVREVAVERTLSLDLQQLSSVTQKIRTYSAAQFPELPAIASSNGLRVTLGAWLNKDPASNQREIAATLVQAAQFTAVERLIIGNETILKQMLSVEQLSAYLRIARRGTKLPVSTAEPWHVWIKHPELAQEVDFITIHLLPYWEGVGLDTAVDESFERLARVRAKFPGKAIVIGEVGYPSSGNVIKKAKPSAAAQAAFVRQFVSRAQTEKLDYFLIEAYDQPWKIIEEGRAGAYWGLFDAARQPKFSFSGPVEPDPHWRVKALASSVAGFVFLVWFCARFPNLRTPSRLAFALAAQGVLSLATAIFTLPMLHYMSASDWILLALLVPTSLVMVAIMLAHLFEFAELFWHGNLRRRFLPRPVQNQKTAPFVSIHLACCNEQPDMVIATIESLRRLDYENYEVLVIDNNTSDPDLWQPVRAHIASLPAKFRFFHLPAWPGYKAGALNFALQNTSQSAQVVAVVDADYVVKPDWLSSLVAYFDDDKVGIVQAPQAHRDWGASAFRKMMNWEYEGFFRIGMHHRNERDAIIQHGTMTMIRAQALRKYGQWAEWCICEDTELGLRLMRHGYTTVYVDQVMGEGLTPDGFADFKKQRKRWAHGGMQILKAHARALLLPASQDKQGGFPARLSLGQRYHFLAGWLPWLGDALHLVFVFAALFWTAGALLLPKYFSFPLALYLMPLAVFCSAKLVMGPLLYWRRVDCSWSDIVGASVAGMGLSHAIARGVIEGLLGKAAVFQITSKGNARPEMQGKKPRDALAWLQLRAVREELLLLLALTLAIAAVALGREPGHQESAYWMAMLLLQCLPYAAALACAALAGWQQGTRAKSGPSTQSTKSFDKARSAYAGRGSSA